MPFHFRSEHEHRILLVVAEGEFSDTDQNMINDAIKKHAIELKVCAGIGDFTQVTSLVVSAGAVQSAARMPSPYPDRTPRFLVAPLDHAFGLARMYKTEGAETRSALQVVRSRHEALEALGVQNPRFERVGAE